MKKIYAFILTLIIQLFVFTFESQASHIVGGDVSYKQIGARIYLFEFKVYRNCDGGIELCSCPGGPAPCTRSINVVGLDGICNGVTLINSIPLNIDQTVSPNGFDIVNLCSSQKSVCTNCGTRTAGTYTPAIEQYTFSGVVDMTSVPSSCCNVSVGWSDCCRNPQITNLTNPSSTSIYIGAQINLCVSSTNNSPVFNNDPVVVVCSGQEFRYNLSAFDPDGDSLSYAFGTSLSAANTPATYKAPYNPTTFPFPYLGSPNYSAPAPLGLNCDPISGDIRFTPNASFVSNLIVEVTQWRYDNGGAPYKVGITRRDLQIYSITSCPTNEIPRVITYNAQGVIQGTNLSNINNYQVQSSWNVYTNINNCMIFSARDGYVSNDNEDTTDLNWKNNNIIVNPNYGNYSWTKLYNSATRALNGPKFDSIKFCWTPNLNAVNFLKNKALFLSVIAADHACPIPSKYVQTIKLNVFNFDPNLISQDTIITCIDSVLVYANQNASNISWSNGSTNYSTYLKAGKYYCNGSINGIAIMDSVFIVVNKSPSVITKQPVSLVVKKDSSAKFTVNATASGPITYQWFKDNISISNSNSNILNFTSVQNSQTGIYYVQVQGACGSVSSDTVSLRIHKINLNAPFISKSLCAFNTTNLTSDVSSPDVLTFIWKKNNQFLPINSSFINFSNFGTSDTGIYEVKITSAFDTLSLGPISLGIKYPISFSQNLSNQYSISKDSVFTLTVKTTGSTPVNFQWYKNDTIPITNNKSDLVIGPFNSFDTLTYKVVASNDCNVINSVRSKVIPRGIIIEATSALIQTQCTGLNARFSAKIACDKTFNCRWFKNNTAIPFAQDTQLNISSLTISDGGQYTLQVFNSTDTANLNFTLKVILSAKELSPISSTSLESFNGQSFSLLYNAGKDTSFTYNWYKDNIKLSSTKDSFYKINSATLADSGIYFCKVTNACSSIQSQSITQKVSYINFSIYPQLSYICEGDNLDLIVQTFTNATGWTFNWYLNSTPLNSKDTALHLVNVKQSQAGNYYYQASKNNVTFKSNPLIVNISKSPSVSIAQKEFTTCKGKPVQLVTTTDANQVIWSPATGLNTTSGNIVSANPDNTTQYIIRFISSFHCNAYDTILVNVIPKLSLQIPSNQILARVGNVIDINFNSNLKIIDNSKINWYLNQKLLNTHDSILRFNPLTKSDSGSLYCSAVDYCNDRQNSNSVKLIASYLKANINGGDTTLCYGDMIQLNADIDGSKPIQSQWYLNGKPLNGFTSPVIAKTIISSADTGKYQMVVKNVYSDSIVSKALDIRSLDPFYFTQMPSNSFSHPNDSASFICKFIDPNVTYHWQSKAMGSSSFNLLSDNTNINGSQTPYLHLKNIQQNQNNTTYRCLVTLPACSIHSNEVNLFVFASGISTLNSITGLKVFPNPGKDEINIQWSNTNVVYPIHLFDVQGKEWISDKNMYSNSKISTNGLAPGIYFIQIGNEMIKWVKED